MLVVKIIYINKLQSKAVVQFNQNELFTFIRIVISLNFNAPLNNLIIILQVTKFSPNFPSLS